MSRSKGKAPASTHDGDSDDGKPSHLKDELEELEHNWDELDDKAAFFDEDEEEDEELLFDDGADVAQLDIEGSVKDAMKIIRFSSSIKDRLRATETMDDKLDQRLSRPTLKERACVRDMSPLVALTTNISAARYWQPARRLLEHVRLRARVQAEGRRRQEERLRLEV